MHYLPRPRRRDRRVRVNGHGGRSTRATPPTTPSRHLPRVAKAYAFWNMRIHGPFFLNEPSL